MTADAVRTYVRDLAERVVSTFFQAAIGAAVIAWSASGLDAAHANDLSAWQKLGGAALVGGVGAVLSLLKGLLAAHTGTPGTASLVHTNSDDESDLGGDGEDLGPVSFEGPDGGDYLVHTGLTDADVDALPGHALDAAHETSTAESGPPRHSLA